MFDSRGALRADHALSLESDGVPRSGMDVGVAARTLAIPVERKVDWRMEPTICAC